MQRGQSRKSIPTRALSLSDDRPGFTFKMNHKRKSITASREWGFERIAAVHEKMFTTSTSAFGLAMAGANATTGVPPRTRSKSISVRTTEQLLDAPPGFRRPRSNSLGVEEDSGIVAVEVCVGDDSDGDIPMQSITPANRARKASICESGYGGSLSHLIPNRILANLSRRISTSNPHPSCSCASCNCTVTPYWRDGWSAEAMLCNACGLRYQKFARRCPSCVYIPRKEDSLGNHCIKCGNEWLLG